MNPYRNVNFAEVHVNSINRYDALDVARFKSTHK